MIVPVAVISVVAVKSVGVMPDSVSVKVSSASSKLSKTVCTYTSPDLTP